METVHENTRDTTRCATGALHQLRTGLSACGGGGSSFGGATKAQPTGPAKLTIMIGSSGGAETDAVKAAAATWSKKSGDTATVVVASDLGQQLGQGLRV